MSFVLVHGRAQEGKDANILHEFWVDSLCKGLATAHQQVSREKLLAASQLPYYGDVLVSPPHNPADIKRSMDAKADLLSEYRQQVKESACQEDGTQYLPACARPISGAGLPLNNQVDPADKLRKSSAAGDAERLRDIQNWPVSLAVARFLDSRWQAASETTIDSLMGDVASYLTEPKVSAAVDQIVSSAIKKATTPLTIVAHSLGSVVAFRVLHALGGEFPVSHLVTIGSPLGVRGVARRMQTALEWPIGVDRWTNGSDPSDAVALRPALDRNSFFKRDEPGRKDVVNLVDIENPTSNKHGIEGYLSDPLVAVRIMQGGF